jgi:hypothetical protein
MTATLPAPAGAGRGARGRSVPGHTVPDHRAASPGALLRGRVRRALLDTPGKLRALAAALILLCVAWGAAGALVAGQHSSAADAVAARDEQLALESMHLYQSVADADATVTAAFLASPTPPLKQLQRYDGDLATAHADLSGLEAGLNGGAGADPAIAPALARLGAGLSDYNGYVGNATSEYAMGFPLTGGSFLDVASAKAHLVLLPAADTVFTQENDQLSAANGQATGLPTMIGLLLLAAVTAIVIYRAQRWLTRRTNRVLSPGLVLASLALAVSVVWVLAAFLGGRSDLDGGIANGSAPAQQLALASIGAQQIRGDAVLNVISRSGSASFSDDFTATSKQVNAELTAARAAQQSPADAGFVSAVALDASAWYAANQQVYAAGGRADYASERDLVVGPGATSAGYSRLEGDFNTAIATDQAVFVSAATQGAGLLDPLAGVLAASAAVMVLGCGWAISRRLAEYR